MAVSTKWSSNPRPHRRLRSGHRGADVRELQQAINARLHARHFSTIKVDGEMGRQTVTAFWKAAFYLGLNHKRLTKGNQRLMRSPSKRTPTMKRRQASRDKALHDQRTATRGPRAAISWWAKHLGWREQPAGSNGGPGISTAQASFGFGRVPWCGIFLGSGLRAAGVNVTSRVASVALIEADAKAHRYGFKGWYSARSAHPADGLVLFGQGVHTGACERVYAWGIKTMEGNTSSGTAGSQSNGGMSTRRNRSFSVIRGAARPAF